MSEDAQNGRRKMDFKVGVGPFSFEGSGMNVLLGTLSIAVLALVGLMYFHMDDQKQTTKAVQDINEGNRLLACIITRSQEHRAMELRSRDSDCRRFARGEI